ncbi:GspE/PulE family protein [Candidatus Nanosynbacter lyticus]|uniref:GspE/PulE family protein n=1 Tax=Candidatus Nanosynbacter lyticus TaxID=2093824 RepID=UPI002552438C|nr:GspE/PulE family protein [Candidatus Nanosynbacter lyticus]WLD47005.1 GspE/PulE family protein [Candidatus Nanosynbacter lyticus]
MDEDRIQQQRRDQDEDATRKRAAILGLQYLDAREFEQTIPLIRDILTIEEMYNGHVVPLAINPDEQSYRFGITSQTPQSLVATMTNNYREQGIIAKFFLISASGFRSLMLRFDPPKKVIYDNIEIAKEGDSDTLQQVSQTLATVGTNDVFNYLIDQADRLNASDIHIENQRDTIRVRMRVDGALHSVAELGRDRYRVIMAALASRANISTASNEPQSGHMQQEIHRDGISHLLNLRVEAVPTMYGQDVVLRLFNFDTSMLNLDLLSIGAAERAQIDEIISHPRGLVLLVGPTGSGKSTTLYSILNALNTPDRKVITLEDPVENTIPGITQIPIDTTAGQRFDDGLRSVLRLDPDVVMVGEIRDQETAKTAIQASITGHLVLSSFHANSTSAAFSRIIDMIGQNPIFSSAVRLLIAQRLVRRLHDESKEEYEPDEATRNWVKEVMQDLPPHVDCPDLDTFKLWRPVATDEVPFGYKGRIPVMEQLVVTEEIQKFLRGDIADVHTEAIEAAAKKHGMVTLLQAGVLAALRGETTLEEVNRVI